MGCRNRRAGTAVPAAGPAAAPGWRGLRPGQVVRLLADDPMADVDVPHFCAEQGHVLPRVGRLDHGPPTGCATAEGRARLFHLFASTHLARPGTPRAANRLIPGTRPWREGPSDTRVCMPTRQNLAARPCCASIPAPATARRRARCRNRSCRRSRRPPSRCPRPRARPRRVWPS